MDRDTAQFRRLITQAKAGDTTAFGELYEVWYTPVYRFVLARVRDTEVAQDVTQDVFMKTFAHLDRFELTNANPLGFLFTTARNAIIDQFKKKKAISLEALEMGDIEDDSARSPQTDSALRLDREHLSLALAQLTEIQQDVLQLRLIEERPVREVAQMLGRSEEAVRQTQVRALRALRLHMNTYE